MSFKEEFRSFFVVYNAGEVFYFNINQKGEIFCREFVKLFGNAIPGAHYIEFTNTGFILQDKEGNKICSLEDYINTLKKFKLITLLPSQTLTKAEAMYIDEDVRTELLELGKLKYNEETSKIPGLLSEIVEENTHTKKRQK